MRFFTRTPHLSSWRIVPPKGKKSSGSHRVQCWGFTSSATCNFLPCQRVQSYLDSSKDSTGRHACATSSVLHAQGTTSLSEAAGSSLPCPEGLRKMVTGFHVRAVSQ